MFTNEFEFDVSITTVLDEDAIYEDVQISISDDDVCIRQWRDDDWVDVIVMSHQQWLECIAAQRCTEGAYYLERT